MSPKGDRALRSLAAAGEAGLLARRPGDASLLEGFRRVFKENGAVLVLSGGAPDPGVWRELGPMGRPSKAGRPTQVRLTEDIISELDEWAAEVREGETFGASGASRSDIIREVVVKALRERREQKAKGANR
jgi:hypothetical protein